MSIATKPLVLSSLLLCFVPTVALAQAAPAATPAPAAKITDEQAIEMMTRAIGLKASGDTQKAAKLYFEVAKSDSKHFGEAAYLLGMQTFEAKRYDLAEKSFRRSVQGNYAPAKAKLLETQALLSAASTQTASSAQSADPNETAIVKQVLAYQARIEVARDQFAASSDALKKLATDDYKAQVDIKTSLRKELEATIKLHNDQLALIPGNTTNPELLKIRNSTTLFKGAYEKFYYTIRPYKIGQDAFLYELQVAGEKELLIRRRMNAAKKAGDSNAWLADEPKMKAQLTEQMAICSRWLTNLAQFKDPEWAREKLNIESIRGAMNTQLGFLGLGMKFWIADRDS